MSSIDESTDTDNNGMEVDVRVDDAVLASDATTVNDRDDEATPRLMITRMVRTCKERVLYSRVMSASQKLISLSIISLGLVGT